MTENPNDYYRQNFVQFRNLKKPSIHVYDLHEISRIFGARYHCHKIFSLDRHEPAVFTFNFQLFFPRMSSSHLIRVLCKLALFLTLAVLIPESSAVPLRLATNGLDDGGLSNNNGGQHQRGSNNNSNRISIRGGGLSLNAGGQKRFRISRGNSKYKRAYIGKRRHV